MIKQFKLLFRLTLMVLLIHFTSSMEAQKNRKKSSIEVKETVDKIDEKKFSGLSYRHIGPFRGGRAAAVTGVSGNPNLYYMGATGGGVWKTENGGQTWNNISDGFFATGSVGAVSVSESNNNIVVVGMGESPVRGVMTSSGDGVYKSVDAGETWEHIGLDGTKHISQVRIHPDNPDVIYVSAQGSPYVDTQDRGVYRTIDGGKNWKKVLFACSSHDFFSSQKI